MMEKRIWLLFLLPLALASCQEKPASEQANKMSEAYAGLTERYDRLHNELNMQMNKTGNAPANDQSSSETNRIMSDKKRDLEALLKEYENGADSDALNLVRSKIMIEVGRLHDAENIIDSLSGGKSGIASEAKLQKVMLHLIRGRYALAVALLKEIEPDLKKDSQFYTICLALAFSPADSAVREEYSLKIIESPELPKAIQWMTAKLYANLAMLAQEKRQTEKAMNYLKKAQALNSDPALKAEWDAQLKQITLFDQPAPPLQADTWLNSPPLTLTGLKGNVVIIDFWAPWCVPCRTVMPTLLEQYNKYKSQGLTVIGYTRLFGRTSDDFEKKTNVLPEEELALLNQSLEKNKITYPIAVSTEGFSFDTYAVSSIPCLVFIGRKGNVASIQTGSATSPQILEKIHSLLEEK
jgi:thiol-disulfide isomerase/thioredoxin